MYDGGFTERSLFALDIPAAQLFCTRLSCGLPAHCTLWRARGGARAPTVLHVYGGPEVQVVTNTYKVSWRIYREIPMYDGGFPERSLFVTNTYKVSWRIYREIPMYHGGFTERSLCIMEDLQTDPYV
ncbi:hypothetical protein O0L34_g12017 [Tuta absoluta]|nr:hypothetical protein O0L34_g12016 [Tuta absoluta]KAJ2938690.1 hypothetical protein O0L34_g12017 [Tuta absoluta]